MTGNSLKHNSSSWNEETAKNIAYANGINSLEVEHWCVLYYLRDYYKDFNQPPSIQKISYFTGLNSLKIYQLFP